MASEELISINVWLAGRSYRIRITPEEEEAVRKAVKLADTQITDLRNTYAGKDDQDFVAMCLLSYAADGALTGLQHPLLVQEVSDMSKKIDDALSNEGK
jgi:cell division protein ZapA (FtsZ GTPase activity inhibitor)